MKICPICETTSIAGVCPVCGFDESTDLEHFPTFGWIQGVPGTLSQKREHWQEELALRHGMTRCSICGGFMTGSICTVCGFDRTTNYEQYPTLAPLGADVDSIARRVEAREVLEGLRLGHWCCPVCGKYSRELLCPRCGFDGSRDPECHPTFGPLPKGIRSSDLLKSLYPLRPVQRLRCPACGGTSFHMSFEEPGDSCTCEGCGTVVARHLILQQKKEYRTRRTEAMRGQFAALTDKPITAIAAGATHLVALYDDGTVRAIGSNSYGQCDTDSWRNVSKIYAGTRHTYAIHADGTVSATGDNSHGECSTQTWTNVVSLHLSYDCAFGVTREGKLLSCGDISSDIHTSRWTDLVEVTGDRFHLSGLRKNGTVVSTGSNYYKQCSVDDWKNICKVYTEYSVTFGINERGSIFHAGDTAGEHYPVPRWNNCDSLILSYRSTIGLLKDGTIKVAGICGPELAGVETWRDIVSIRLAGENLLGLRSDGTVLASGGRSWDQEEWSSIVDLAVGSHIVGLKADGTLVFADLNDYGQNNIGRLMSPR